MHDLLRDLKQVTGASKLRQFTSGISLPFRAAGFLGKNPQLIPFVIIPTMINIALFALSAWLLINNAGSLVDWLWEKPVIDGILSYLLVALWYVVFVLVHLVAVVVSYAIVLLVGGIVASPFHDFLSEQTERILRGVEELPESDESVVWGLIRSIGSSAFIGLSYAAIMLPILLLNLVPGLGSVVATVLGTCVSAFFVSLEYTDPTLQRHEVPLKQKLRLIWQHLPLTGSFGLGTSLLLWVPLMNFVCMPIAVIGGTALGIALEEEPSNASSPSLRAGRKM
jgi:CysZ protein